MSKRFRSKPPGVAPFKSAHRLQQHVQKNALATLDAREWDADWQERWVTFVDLIAFAARSLRSRDVVLNNIVRFDRASAMARVAVPEVKVFRFSDSTFGVSEHFGSALAFG